MSTSDYQKFPAGTQDKGLNNFEPDIGAEVSWDETTQNVTGGVRRGVGPRYGTAPLAGHSNTETPAGDETNGIQRSEITSGSAGLTFRELIFGIVPLTYTPYDGTYPKANRQYYLYLVGLDDTSNVTIDSCIGATKVTGVNKQASTFVAGLAESSYRQETLILRRLHKTELLNLPPTGTPVVANVQAIVRQVTSRYWMPYSHISVSGKRVPYQWMLADVTTVPDGTTAPSMCTWQATFSAPFEVLGGSSSEIITREFTANNQRLASIYCLDNDGYPMDIQYTKQITQANTTPQIAYNPAANYITLTGATKTGASTAYGSVQGALLSDPGSFTNTRHDAILIAGETPLALVYQDWLVASIAGTVPRWVDLTNPGCNPRIGMSLQGFANQVNPSGLSPNSGSSTIGLDANSGFLRADVEYDLGFSYYNKLLDYETNVVYADTIYQHGVDNYAAALDWSATANFNIWEEMRVNMANAVPWEYSDGAEYAGGDVGRGMHINDYELRFYYRQAGIGEWLPAGNYDASLYWFYAWPDATASSSVYGPPICNKASGAIPGGQPNGFIDYSPLPKQRYICTTVFQQRAFWWSEKSMHFSLVNNIYAYPTRNIVSCPTGKWRGGIVHIRNGINQQVSRLVVFGDTVFSSRFTGERTAQNVRISSDTVGQFEVDGSDFRMEYLCESTAFSFRSSVVADGILYWWGPQGIYRDDGINEPKKISGILEQEIFAYVDMARDIEVHCVYNKRTSEIIWFYPPKVTDATYPTHGLVYNVENGQFYPFKIRFQVDSSQNIRLENDDTPDGVDGERILLHCRETTSSTVQRTFYFDDLVKAGDQGPARELTILSFSTPSAGQRRLTFAAGSVGVTAGSIEPNDLICIQNAKGYAPTLTLADDMIAKIVAVNNASSYIDIELPDDADMDASATLTGQTAFPIYQRKPAAAGLHGIVYTLQTNYWLPDGLSNSWMWIYLYFLYKYTGIPTPTNPFTGRPAGTTIDLSYRSLVCRAALTDTLSLVNNSANHCQIHHPLRNDGRAANGQALAYALSGIHIGDPWTLEYLEAHCKAERGFTLREFEG